MTGRVWLVAVAAVLGCSGGGDSAAQTISAGCDAGAGLCIGRTGPADQVNAEMALCVSPSVPVASCPTAGCLGGCKQVQGELVEITWFYAPWTLVAAQATCDAPDVWVAAP